MSTTPLTQLQEAVSLLHRLAHAPENPEQILTQATQLLNEGMSALTPQQLTQPEYLSLLANISQAITHISQAHHQLGQHLQKTRQRAQALRAYGGASS